MIEHPFFLIILTSSVAGLLAGFVMHRSDFCVTATFRDMFMFRDFFLMRMLLILVVVSMFSFELGHATGILKPYPFPILAPPSVATLIGGIVFGTGMVLAGGCVVGTLYKFGAGSMLSGVAFLGMIAGSAFYAEWHPGWSAFAKSTILTPGVTLPQTLSLPPALLILPLASVGAFFLWRWHKQRLLTRASFAQGHIAPWEAALILAALGFASYFFIGMPLGITTSYAKIGSLVEGLFAPEHVASLAYFTAQPVAYTPPFSTEIIRGGAGPALDAIAAIQYPLVIGIILGGALSALLIGEYQLHFHISPAQYISAIIGGVLLGMAARMVPGCNIWHLWGGLPILANQSLLFLLGILPGTWLGSQLLQRFVLR